MGLTDFFKTGPSFKASELRESSEDLCNPDRGWYRMYTYDFRKEGPGRDELPEISGIAPSMVLLLFCIGSVSEDESSQAVLADRMLGIIDHFRFSDNLKSLPGDTAFKGIGVVKI